MRRGLRKTIIKMIPPFLKRFIINIRNRFFDGFAVKSYSQEGEDLILRRFFESGSGETGFYVDIGAHHPFRFSNTYLFYKMGWNGINIDATPGSMALFNKIRPRDINLEYAISDTEGTLTYYMFKDAALNTFSRELADNYVQDGQNLLNEEILNVYTLSKVLGDYLDQGMKIDFMSIDAEGFDLKVLKSNDWSKYRPTVLLVESLDFDFLNPDSFEIYEYLTRIGYKLFSKTINTLFFIKIK